LQIIVRAGFSSSTAPNQSKKIATTVNYLTRCQKHLAQLPMLQLVFKWEAVMQAATQISSLSAPHAPAFGMRIAMNMADASGN
jgi:hypothetical protein